MTLFTQHQLETLCRSNGWPTADPVIIRTAGAIALVEAQVIINGVVYSDSTRVGDQALANATWGPSYGNWQDRSLRAEKGTGGHRDEDRLPDPDFNCRTALWAYQTAKGFTPWSTYNSGAYKAYLQDLYPAPPDVYVVVGGDTLSRIASRLSTLTGFQFTWQDLARVNGLKSPYWIHPGEHLFYPWVTHNVLPGETLSGIAATYGSGVTWQAVAAFNSITGPDYLIQPGQSIRIPSPNL